MLTTRQSLISIILMFITLGLADGNPTPSPAKLKVSVLFLGLTIVYSLSMLFMNYLQNKRNDKHIKRNV